MLQICRGVPLAIFIAGLSGCTPLSGPTSPPPSTTHPDFQLNEGYSLLYHLLNKDRQVAGIFILKSADPNLKDLIHRIGQACQTARDRLNQFAEDDKQLKFNVDDLPYIEQRSRELQESDDRSALLASHGEPFERRLIFTQAQAMNYVVQLSRALQEKEPNPQRKAFLHVLQMQCTQFHDQLMTHLRAV